ncbi:MAG: hypothetical protein ABL888_22285 [Pirellulaceae bacterium]
MTKSNYTLLTILLLTAIGCSGDDPSGTTSKNTSESTRGKKGELRLVIWSADPDEDEIIHRSPTAALIEQEIRKQNWQTTGNDAPPYVYVQRHDQFISCWVTGSLAATNPDDQLELHCNGSGANGIGTTHSAKIKNIDDAVKVLVSYFHDDGKWLDAVDWNSRPQKGY